MNTINAEASTSSAGRYVPPALRSRSRPSSPEVSRSTRLCDSGHPRQSPHSRTPWASQPSSPSPSRRQPLLPGQSENPDPTITRHNTVTVDVFGDSFVGPLSLLDAEQVRIHRYKGASAKGLNNPNSVKQVAKLLVPAVNRVLAPPPYVYMPPTSKYALFIFGNVDLQINYLYQLQTKSLETLIMDHADVKDASRQHGSSSLADSSYPTPPPSASILENATETPSVGPALGPSAFVETVTKAYMAFLEREIIEGPIGERIRSGLRKGKAKVVIAGALPPFVTDDMLERIVDKYVVRLEESHAANEAAIRADEDEEEMFFGKRSRTPWSKTSPSPQLEPIDPEEPSEPPAFVPQPVVNKTPLSTLLEHQPPLCTLPVRRRMTDMYNQRMADFCALHPEVLAFVDVGALMDRDDDDIDRQLYACPVDPTNIHPVWETTLPLWMRSLKEAGVDGTQLHMSADAEETFRAYEKEKRERTAAAGHSDDIGTGRGE